jgi:hypothetical protein
MLHSWVQAVAAAAGLITIVVLTILAVWARNIGKDVLRDDIAGSGRPIAGVDGRDDYPAYREQLAASALPCCVFVPAMIFGLLELFGRLPLTIAGRSGFWLDALVYVLLAFGLAALFVQLPFQGGNSAWLRQQNDRLEKLRQKVTDRITAVHDTASPRPGAALEIIAGELTLQRLREASRELRAQQIFRFNLFGESISGADAVSFVRGLVVTAITAGAGVLINALFQVPN